MAAEPVLIAGRWRPALATETFTVDDPTVAKPLPAAYPVSAWSDCDEALSAAAEAQTALLSVPDEQRAAFLDEFARHIEGQQTALVEIAAKETGLPAKPRLADVELPRTVNQLRQAAAAAREGSWAMPTIDTKLNIRSCLEPLGPVCVFGPNNFPFAFNSIAGGDFAAAIAAGNPVIAKANSSHPGTSLLLGKLAHAAAEATEMPPGTVQLIYRTSHEDGERLVADPRVGASAYTGSRAAGLKLKQAADRAGKPIYLELSSINPLVILPGAIAERADKLAEEFTASCLMGAGQFCTNPGLVLLEGSPSAEQFIANVAERFATAPVSVLLSRGVAKSLAKAIDTLRSAGAEKLVGGAPAEATGYRYQNTLLRVGAAKFLEDPEAFQTEAFGNASLVVVAKDAFELDAVLEHLEGNLTGAVYSATTGADESAYARVAPLLRRKVGRLLNDKMPTGVAVSAAMNHGGPYPATGHPGFTAVGIPAALRRFGALVCYDNVRESRLPQLLRNANARKAWRFVDGTWTQADVSS